jgi:hypothetical protein
MTRTFFLAIALFAPALKGASPSPVFLVSAGNNTGLENEPLLQYAEDDALRIMTVFQMLGGVSPHNAAVLLGANAQELRRTLLAVNSRIRRQNEALRRKSVLVVFYSGHADASGLHLGQNLMDYDEIKTLVSSSPAAFRLLIVDSCRSGVIVREKGFKPAAEFEISLQHNMHTEGMAIITSSTAGEESYESDALRSSFFSHHLFNALRGAADTDKNGAISLDEAYQYTYQQTLRSSGRSRRLQHPTYKFDVKGRGALVLTKLVDTRKRSGTLLIPTEGHYLITNGDEGGSIVADLGVQRSGTRLILPAGSYFVQRRSRDHYREYKLRLKAEREVNLDKVDFDVIKYARLARKGGSTGQIVHSISILGGIRSGPLNGQGALPVISLGVSFDFPWLSFGLRGLFSRARMSFDDQDIQAVYTQAGGALTVRRYIDFSHLSIGLGLNIEVLYNQQFFQTQGKAPDRGSWSIGFGGLLSAEIQLSPEIGLLVESGPTSQVLLQGTTRNGAVDDSEITTTWIWWLSAGIAWRF